MNPEEINKTKKEERFAEPIYSWFGNIVRELYSKTTDSTGLFGSAFAWLLSTLLLRSWAFMGRAPSDLANFLKLPKGHAFLKAGSSVCWNDTSSSNQEGERSRQHCC